MKWLVHHDSSAEILDAHRALMAHTAGTNTELAEALGVSVEVVVAAREGNGRPASRDLKVSPEGVATIEVRGVLLDAPNWMYDLFGRDYSDYQTIRGQLAQANADPSVLSIALDVSSPGGMVAGVFEAADDIAASPKAVHAQVRGQAASAAYLLASQATTVHATTRADAVGSIGVAVDMRVDGGRVSIASTDAPNKRPDVTTEQGRAIVRAELDAVHALFVDVVARGRGVEAATVSQDFGRGGVLLATEALAAGMIDALDGTPLGAPAPRSGRAAGASATVLPMELSALLREHPDTYAAAVAVGVASERKRAASHLRLGGKAQALTQAIAAVIDGSEFEAVDYFEAMADRKMSAAREGANPGDTGAADGTPEADPVLSEIVAAAAQLDIVVKA